MNFHNYVPIFMGYSTDSSKNNAQNPFLMDDQFSSQIRGGVNAATQKRILQTHDQLTEGHNSTFNSFAVGQPTGGAQKREQRWPGGSCGLSTFSLITTPATAWAICWIINSLMVWAKSPTKVTPVHVKPTKGIVHLFMWRTKYAKWSTKINTETHWNLLNCTCLWNNSFYYEIARV